MKQIKRSMSILIAAVAAALFTAAATEAQTPPAPAATPAPGIQSPTDISLDISKGGMQKVTLAIPPAIAPINPDLQTRVVDPFHATLVDDLGGSACFGVADAALYPKGSRPPANREQGDSWIATGAHFLVDAQVQPVGDQVVVVAQLWDLRTLKPVLGGGKKYSGDARSARRIAHYLANDIMRQFWGKPGPFLTRIAFVSDRDGKGTKEIYLMDYDGEGQTRISYHNSLSLAPDWFRDGAKIVYQCFVKGSPALYTVSKDGGEKKQIATTTSLNSSPSVSPDGRTIAFCGSVKGNTEIYTIGADGGGQKRLTDNSAIDSTPRWAPNGRELVFTSNRQGSPQLYVMDLEGANVRRLTFAGNWNDEGNYSPDGSRLAFACRNDAEMNICVLDLATGRTTQISRDPGAHENPTWSPDGSKIAWEVSRGSSTQIVLANADGTNAKVITSAGNNFSPSWSKTLE